MMLLHHPHRAFAECHPVGSITLILICFHLLEANLSLHSMQLILDAGLLIFKVRGISCLIQVFLAMSH